MLPLIAVERLWALWVISWFVAAIWSARTTARPPLGSQFLNRALTFVGAALLFGSLQPRFAATPLWRLDDTAAWAMVALSATGFLFTWWARIHLGALWSGWVTKKAGHHVVDTGPYRLVRHPIYTGITLASFATAALAGSVPAFAGAAIMLLGWYVKAREEEKFLRAELDPDAYDAYAARVPMLIPFMKI